MKIKNLVLCSLVFCMIFCLTACGGKKAITTSEFTSICEGENLIVQDVTDQYAEFDYIKEGTAAVDDSYQIEFYVLEDEDSAKGMFASNKKEFEAMKNNTASEKSISTNHSDVYSLSTSGMYKYLSRVDNTLLYADNMKNSKDDVKKLVDKLGY